MRPSPSPRASRHRARRSAPEASHPAAAIPLSVVSSEGPLLSVARERQELLCSVIGLGVKFGLVAVAGVSLMRVAGAYQQRMERQGEIAAVLELEAAKLAKARERFDQLFRIEGEQRLLREQSQWIAPNRMRVVWRDQAAFPTVQTAQAGSGAPGTLP